MVCVFGYAVCVSVCDEKQTNLESHDQVQAMCLQGVNGVDDQSDDDINTVGLVFGYTGLKRSRGQGGQRSRVISCVLYVCLPQITVRLGHHGYTHTHTHTHAQYLVLMAGPLTVLGEGLQGLADQVHVDLVDVQAQKPQAPRGAATDAVQELQSLTHQVVDGLVLLVPEKVLEGREGGQKVEMVSWCGAAGFRQKGNACL